MDSLVKRIEENGGKDVVGGSTRHRHFSKKSRDIVAKLLNKKVRYLDSDCISVFTLGHDIIKKVGLCKGLNCIHRSATINGVDAYN